MQKYLTKTQVKTLLSKCTTLRDYLLVRTKYEIGCTISEIVEIKASDLQGRTISIRNRKSTVSKELATQLQNHAKNTYLFSTRQSPQMSQKRAEQLIKARLQAAGISATPQILRYSHVVHAAQKGISVEEIQQQTGLGSLRVAQICAEHVQTTPQPLIQTVSKREEVLIRLLQETGAPLQEVVAATKQQITATGITLTNKHYALTKKLLSALQQAEEYVFSSRQAKHISTRRANQLIQQYLNTTLSAQSLRYQAITYQHEKNTPLHTIAENTNRGVLRVQQILCEHQQSKKTYKEGLL